MKASASVVSAPLARMSRSPLVSAPRRTLPTVAMSAAGACSFRYATSASAISVARDRRWRPANALPLLDRLENQLLLLAAHALDAADAPGLGGRRKIIEARDAELLVEHGDGLGSDALQPQHIEQRRREFGQQVATNRAIAGRRDLANTSREVLADAVPAAKRRFVERRTPLRPHATTMSAALRYARILKGFSPFSSSRSAISSSVRATDLLSSGTGSGVVIRG